MTFRQQWFFNVDLCCVTCLSLSTSCHSTTKNLHGLADRCIDFHGDLSDENHVSTVVGSADAFSMKFAFVFVEVLPTGALASRKVDERAQCCS